VARRAAASPPLDHTALRASLRAAGLVETPLFSIGVAYAIACSGDVLIAIGAYRTRFERSPEWFEWEHPSTLILGPVL